MASTAVEPSIPWPQRRFDVAALGRITDGAGVSVAVIDSGVDASHPQLSTAVVPGYDLLGPGGDGRMDCVGHGTAVASIIAGRPVAGMGLRGLAPGTTIVPVRVSERIQTGAVIAGAGDLADLAAGVWAAVRARPRPAVISLSISTMTDDPDVRQAITAAIAADIVVVAAVGNRHTDGGGTSHDPVPYPAAYPGVVGVGAAGPDGRRQVSSQVGPFVDLVAPGDEVIGAVPGGGHAELAGTSFAVPFVSATAALIRAHWPGLDQAAVFRRLILTTDPVSGARPSPEYGYGMLNPLRALTELVGQDPHSAPTRPAPAAPSPRRLATSTDPTGPVALTTAGVLIALGAALATTAALVPAGRRRRWRPGQAR